MGLGEQAQMAYLEGGVPGQLSSWMWERQVHVHFFPRAQAEKERLSGQQIGWNFFFLLDRLMGEGGGGFGRVGQRGQTYPRRRYRFLRGNKFMSAIVKVAVNFGIFRSYFFVNFAAPINFVTAYFDFWNQRTKIQQILKFYPQIEENFRGIFKKGLTFDWAWFHERLSSILMALITLAKTPPTSVRAFQVFNTFHNLPL